MPAYAYLRKSVVRTEDPKNSPEAQEAAVRAMARRYDDDQALTILSDWDKSGRLGREKRPGYDALWRAIETGKATAVYSYSLSRLARSVSELTRMFEVCRDRAIPIRLEADVIDTSTASGRMVAGILAQVAAFEADVAGERLKAALVAKAARGERIGTAPFYGDQPGEDPAAVLAAFHEAGSFSATAKLLNDRGIKPRGSKRGWWPSSVAVVVRRLEPGLPVLRANRGYRAGGTDFALARLLRCPTCATSLTGTRDRDGRRVRYSCRLGTALPHPRISVTESHVLPAIIDEVQRWIRTPIFQATADVEDQARAAKLAEDQAELKRMFDRGLLKEGPYRLALADLEPVVVEEDESWIEDLDPRNLPTVWTHGTPAQQNRALRRVFDQIVLDPATFQPLGYKPRPRWRRA